MCVCVCVLKQFKELYQYSLTKHSITIYYVTQATLIFNRTKKEHIVHGVVGKFRESSIEQNMLVVVYLAVQFDDNIAMLLPSEDYHRFLHNTHRRDNNESRICKDVYSIT